MKTEAEFRKAIDEAKANYLAIVDTAPAAESLAASRVVTGLQAELQAFLAEGAIPCPNCQNAPIGMLKTPEVVDRDGNLKSGSVYEVGCAVCVVPIRARGSSPASAVGRWNDGQYVVERIEEPPVAEAEEA